MAFWKTPILLVEKVDSGRKSQYPPGRSRGQIARLPYNMSVILSSMSRKIAVN
jgi:hypothetical protein